MAKVAILLSCLVIFLVFDKSFGWGGWGGRRAGTPCKTDNTCGDNPVTESLDGTDYCCSEGSRIKLKPPRGYMTEARCKCIEAGAGGEEPRGRGGHRGRGPHRRGPHHHGQMRCNYENDCDEGSVSGTSNGISICCPAGHVVNKETVERRGRTFERCTCQMPPTEAPV